MAAKRTAQVYKEPKHKLLEVEAAMGKIQRISYSRRTAEEMRRFCVLSSYRSRLRRRIKSGTWE